ncbi:MAG TPA: hypothetical protein VFS75_02605 [Candidatus Paceibacterota bacterium]|nr:hypothetical protein [Candidatus Paceibacterota bacterium]
MPPENSRDHDEMLRLLRENNALLKKLYRHNIISYVLKALWYAILIGLPFAVYFYFLEPYFRAFGSDYDTFRQGMDELPGVKEIQRFLQVFVD